MAKKSTKVDKVIRVARPAPAKPRGAAPTTRPLTLKVDAVFEREADGRYSASVPALPGCFSYGDNLAEARANIREAAELWLEARRALAAEGDEPRGAAR